MKDFIQLDCDMPWISDSHIQVHRNDEKGWPVLITFTREDSLLDLHADFLLREKQVVKLRDYLDSVLREKALEDMARRGVCLAPRCRCPSCGQEVDWGDCDIDDDGEAHCPDCGTLMEDVL